MSDLRWRTLLTPLILLLFVVDVAAQNDSTEDTQAEVVDVPCTLEAGDTVALKITQLREQSGDDVRQMRGSIESTVDLEVREKNDRGFVISWRAQWHEAAEGLAGLERLGGMSGLADALEEVNAHELLIQTDEYATPLELMNLEETATLFQRILDQLIESMSLKESERAAVELVLEQLLNPDLLVSRVLQDARLYFMFTGGSFELGEMYVVDDQVANPFGGSPLPSQIHFIIRSLDRETDVAHIDYAQRTDEAAVRGMLLDVFQQLPNGEEILEELEGVDVGVSSEAVYFIDLSSGLPDRIEFEKHVRMGPGERTDRMVIETVSRSSR